jgi:hypothetical protein
MAAGSFDFAPLLTTGLPPPAAKWTGFAKYNFTGGHNDADIVPVDRLVAAATAVGGGGGGPPPPAPPPLRPRAESGSCSW